MQRNLATFIAGFASLAMLAPANAEKVFVFATSSLASAAIFIAGSSMPRLSPT